MNIIMNIITKYTATCLLYINTPHALESKLLAGTFTLVPYADMRVPLLV